MSNRTNEKKTDWEREQKEGWDTFDWLCILSIFYCHGIGCWELFPHILLSNDIFDWNGLYSISWSWLPPAIDIDEKAWKKFDLSGMLIFGLLFVGRTIVEPDDDEDDEDDGGGDAKPLLNIELFLYIFVADICERWPTILRGGTPVNCIGGGTCCWG